MFIDYTLVNDARLSARDCGVCKAGRLADD